MEVTVASIRSNPSMVVILNNRDIIIHYNNSKSVLVENTSRISRPKVERVIKAKLEDYHKRPLNYNST